MSKPKTWCDHKQHDRCHNAVCSCSCHVAPTRDQAAILAAQLDREAKASVTTVRVRELIAAYPPSRRGVDSPIARALKLADYLDEISNPLRGAPSEDTMRVEHSPSRLTSVESAADWSEHNGRALRWEKKLKDQFRDDLEALVERHLRKLDPQASRPTPIQAPQCWRRACGLRGRKQAIGAEVCRGCNEPFGAKAEGETA